MAYLFKYYARIYDSFMRRFKLDSNEVLLESLGELKGKRILDLGGGTGTLADKLQRMGGDVTLIDPQKEMTAIAKAKNTYLTIYNETLEEVMQHNEVVPFDIVVIRDALHHISNQQEVIRQVALCLADEGILVMSEFNIRHIKTICIWCFETLCFERCRMFTKKSLLNLCSPYFKNQEIRSISAFEMLYKGEKNNV
ncbi:MAG: class I SAM-dependent methyltransferase [Candidatus Niameybacter stercoravium]|nr:class I SAM-dependent methyltransferase [Candidatus Niameybacter stercoravium]